MSAKLSLLIFWGSFALFYFIFRFPTGEDKLDKEFTNTFKGIAMLLILYHHSGIYHANEFWYLFFSGWCFSGVSLFFFISGFGLAVSYTRNQYTYISFFRRRLVALWPVIAICMIIRGIAAPLIGKELHFETSILHLLGLHEWYILAITLWYIFFIIIIKNAKTSGDIHFLFFIFPVILWAVLDVFFPNASMAYQWMRFPFSFALGVIFAQHSEKIMQHLRKRLLIVTFFSLTAVILSTQLQNQHNLVYPMMDMAILPLGLCLVLWVYKFGINSKLLIFIGKYSLPIYLMQVPLIRYGVLLKSWRMDMIGLITTWCLIFLLSFLIVQINKLIFGICGRLFQHNTV